MKITCGLISFPRTEVEVYVEDCLLKRRINTRFDIKDFSEVNVEVFKITKICFWSHVGMAYEDGVSIVTQSRLLLIPERELFIIVRS